MKTLKWISNAILLCFLGSITWVSASYIIPNLAVTTAKIASQAVTTAKIANGAVGSTQIASQGVATSNIANNAVGTNQIASQAVTQAELAPRPGPSPTVSAGGIAVSSTSGAYSASNTSFVTVTNLSVTITTTGRPVFVGIIPDPANGLSNIGINASGAVQYRFQRGSTALGTVNLNNANSSTAIELPNSIFIIDYPSASTYTYTFQVAAGGASTITINNADLIAYEL
jgi:hypothetical protein